MIAATELACQQTPLLKKTVWCGWKLRRLAREKGWDCYTSLVWDIDVHSLQVHIVRAGESVPVWKNRLTVTAHLIKSVVSTNVVNNGETWGMKKLLERVFPELPGSNMLSVSLLCLSLLFSLPPSLLIYATW